MRAFDARVEQLFEGLEQDALQVDGQRQQPVEKSGDRGQLVAEASLVHERKSGRLFEGRERAALDLAARDQGVELAQSAARIVGLRDCLRAGTAPALRFAVARA